jgi:hypothetical protein
VHEYVLAAIIGLDEAEPLVGIEPFYATGRHLTFSLQEQG